MKAKNTVRAVEFVLIFVGLPLAYRLGFLPFPVIPVLLVVTLFCFLCLYLDPDFDRRQFWRPKKFRLDVRRILTVFVPASILLLLVVLIFQSEHLFQFPRKKPHVYALVMFLYPVLSVYPQELVYRAFFFQRYQNLFRNVHIKILVSALCFGWLHIIYQNVPSVLLSFLGGYLFAVTYERSRSLCSVSFEHALYGCFIFTVGLGHYFFSSQIG